MARPQKNNADYFSHDNDMRDDEKIKALRRKFSHAGYSVWNMLLERLCKAENFCLEYSEETLDIMAGDFSIEPEQLKEIIDYLIKLKLILQDGEMIFSQTMINRFEGLLRKRKRDTDRLSPAITTDKKNIASDNPQSKVKKSIVKEIKEKEKGEKENAPLSFRKFLNENISNLKKVFEKHAAQYVWERADEEHLFFLAEKIFQNNPKPQDAQQLAEAFENFLVKLPTYWRTKKFTIPNLNKNFNEIISEMQSAKNVITTKTPVKPIIPAEIKKNEPTPEERKEVLKKMLPSIAEAFETFVHTGKQGYVPFWAMYDALVQEKIYTPSEKKINEVKKQCITARIKELNKPKTPFEQKHFAELLAEYKNGNTPNTEQILIERSYKGSLIKSFFEKLQSQNKNLNHLKAQ